MNSETSDERIGQLLDYWFQGEPADCDRPDELMRRWFAGSRAQDLELREKFGQLAKAAASGELDSWDATAHGRLALIILLDQLPRSLHRGTPAAFACDAKALDLCLDGLDRSEERTLHALERIFFCMPLQHSESPDVQARSLEAFRELAISVTEQPLASVLENTQAYAREHHEIVDRFGRFPHRNQTLGRESTIEELEFLNSGGSTFGQ